MVLYICMQVEARRLNYNAFFRIPRYAKAFKDDVDAMLTADGYEIGSDGYAVKKDAEAASSTEVTA
jgi:hypothetical protein